MHTDTSVGDRDTGSGESLPLPERLEARFHEIYFGYAEPARSELFEALCAEHEELADVLRERHDRLQQSDRMVGAARHAVEPAPAPPDRVGAYRIVREIGRGGFGVVYLAEQDQPIRRTVALKLLLPDVTHARALERFDAERNALAMMAHPNIANVFDAGTATPDGRRPYFVMEHVDGQPITTWCDVRRIGIEARLALFLRVCAGVQHAHQKGILHRDIKPSNILVTEQDGESIPKIIDFGIAKALHEDVSRVPFQTEHGRILGTPEYMSPEQAGGEEVDTRTDIYALGVLLYELLTGALPFESTELRGVGVVETARIIREIEPLRPSEALSRKPDRARAAAACRGLELRQLLDRLRGDLDQVLIKALAKDREERYGSVSELAAEVRRYLAHQPVVARPPTITYLARKFVRRHRVAVTVTGSVVLLVVLGIAFALWSLVQIDAARAEAVRGREAAEANAYAASIAAAKAAIDGRDAIEARRHLAQAPARLRGWEWRYLDGRCDGSLAVIGVDTGIRDVLLAPDGSVVVTVTEDGAISWWDCAERRMLRWTGPAGFWRVALSPDGATLAAASLDGTLSVLDFATGELRGTPWRGVAPLRSVAFAPDGRRIAFGSGSGVRGGACRVRVVDVGGGDVVELPPRHSADVFSLDVSADGKLLASGGLDARVLIWDLAGRRVAHELDAPDDLVRCVQFSADATLLAAASRDGTIRVWDTGTAAMVREIECPTTLWEIAFRPRGDRGGRAAHGGRGGREITAAGGYRGECFVGSFDVATGARTGEYLGHVSGVAALAWSRDGTQLATGSADRTVRLWAPEPLAEPRVGALARGATAFAADRDGGRLLVGTAFGVVACRDVGRDAGGRSWQRTLPFAVDGVAFDPSGRRVYAGGAGQPLLLLDAASGETLREGTDALREPTGISVSPDGELLAAGSWDGAVVVFDAERLTEVRTLQHQPGVVTAEFDTRGRWLATCHADHRIRLWEPDTGRLLRTLEGHTDRVTRCAFNPAGTLLASAGEDRTVRLFDPTSGACLRTMTGHASTVYAIDFSPDGARLATGGLDNSVRVWDVERTTELCVFHEPTGNVGFVRFGRDGRWLLATTHESAAMYVWEVRSAPPTNR